MIRIRVSRVEDSGSRVETELGELRFAELGAAPAAYSETAEGSGVMRDVRAALACLAPDTLRAVRAAACLCVPVYQYGKPSLRALDGDCPVHAHLLRRSS